MKLPKIAKKKLIDAKEFEKAARLVRKSFEEEAKYVTEKNLKYGDTISLHIHKLS